MWVAGAMLSFCTHKNRVLFAAIVGPKRDGDGIIKLVEGCERMVERKRLGGGRGIKLLTMGPSSVPPRERART
jgi:hypothetical protein